MDCSMPGLPVHHQLAELTQTQVHGVGDAFQPSSSVAPFSFCLPSFPASESFPVSHFFTSDGPVRVGTILGVELPSRRARLLWAADGICLHPGLASSPWAHPSSSLIGWESPETRPSSEEHAMAELRPVRHQSGLTHSGSLLLQGQYWKGFIYSAKEKAGLWSWKPHPKGKSP